VKTIENIPAKYEKRFSIEEEKLFFASTGNTTL